MRRNKTKHKKFQLCPLQTFSFISFPLYIMTTITSASSSLQNERERERERDFTVCFQIKKKLSKTV
jgi:hypothetical protein